MFQLETSADSKSPQKVDAEKGTESLDYCNINTAKSQSDDDEACSKLWEVYINEAKRYDISLLQGWKSDMESMLFFSALYSASLTAFIIESYKTLQAAPEDTTVSLLTQMTRQLAFLSNGTAVGFEEPLPFQPPISALLCNSFWFLSLALALTCSLLATFVQQWTRDFIHKVNMRPSAVLSARILAFSYFGLRRFGMHIFIDIIPVLLHISLFLFFAGLVAFLQPVNFPLMCLMACVLLISVLIYIGLSCVPLICLDAPYRTPLSDILWRLGHMLGDFVTRFRNHKPRRDKNRSLTLATLSKSLDNPAERDRKCIEYTIKSLDHDKELLPLFEAIPEALLSPTGVRHRNWSLILPLVQITPHSEHSNIVSRISDFISRPGASIDPEYQTRRTMTSLNALWSLAYYLVAMHSHRAPEGIWQQAFWFDRNLLKVLTNSSSGLSAGGHFASAIALVRMSRVQSFKSCIDSVFEVLFSSQTSCASKFQTSKTIIDRLTVEDVDWESGLFRDSFNELSRLIALGCTSNTDQVLEDARGVITSLQRPGRWKAAQLSILGQLLSSALKTNKIPHNMDLTYQLICSAIKLPFHLLDPAIEITEDEAIASYTAVRAITLPPTNNFNGRETVPYKLFMFCVQVFYSTQHAHSPKLIPAKCRAIMQGYICRNSPDAYFPLLRSDAEGFLLECVLRDLREGAQDSSYCLGLLRCIYHTMSKYALSTGASLVILPPLRVFALQIFDILPAASTLFTHHRLYKYLITYTEWILCKDIIDNLVLMPHGNDNLLPLSTQTIDVIRALGRSVLPDSSVPQQPPLPWKAISYNRWIEDLLAYMVSMNLVIIAKYITICIDFNHQPTVPKFSWTSFRWYQGHVYPSSQIALAKSICKLVYAYTKWGHSRSLPPWIRLFESDVWLMSQDWGWITDLKSAKILIDAIECHRDAPNFGGMLWYEQALLDRCRDIVTKAGQGSN